jgi:hypothetical protein
MGRAEIEILRSAYEAADRGDWDATFLHAQIPAFPARVDGTNKLDIR